MAKQRSDRFDIRAFFRSLGVNDVSEDWARWLRSSDKAIWGDLFGTEAGKALNNFFASVCLKTAFTAASTKGRIAFFDATNTDMARRAAIIKLADDTNKPVVFVENLCVNSEKLFKNFLDKVVSSGDYKASIEKGCGDDANAMASTLKRYDNRNLDTWATGVDMSGACASVISASLSDIMVRDLGYLNKYVPMHTATKTTPSTIDRINGRGPSQVPVGYVQIMIKECKASGTVNRDDPPVLWQSNLPHRNEMLRALLEAAETSGNVKVDTYADREDAVQFGDLMNPQDDIRGIMDTMTGRAATGRAMSGRAATARAMSGAVTRRASTGRMTGAVVTGRASTGRVTGRASTGRASRGRASR
jgi:hypothetical protein